jgi:hypothetical protein
VSGNWRAEYARRFHRVAIERPVAPFKPYAEWTDEELRSLLSGWHRDVALMCRQIRQSAARAMGVLE